MVPHGRGHHASAELEQQANSRDVQGRHVPNDCLPNHLSVLSEAHGAFSLEHYLATRSLLWAGHVARMSKSRSPKKLMLPLAPGPRIANRQEMT